MAPQSEITRLETLIKDTYGKRIGTLERMLGVSSQKTRSDGKGGLSEQKYAEGFGPTRTLLGVDFTLAPGYVVWNSGLAKTQNRAPGEEPARNEGDIHVNKFRRPTEVLCVPYYMLAEQVAQLIRCLNLSTDCKTFRPPTRH